MTFQHLLPFRPRPNPHPSVTCRACPSVPSHSSSLTATLTLVQSLCPLVHSGADSRRMACSPPHTHRRSLPCSHVCTSLHAGSSHPHAHVCGPFSLLLSSTTHISHLTRVHILNPQVETHSIFSLTCARNRPPTVTILQEQTHCPWLALLELSLAQLCWLLEYLGETRGGRGRPGVQG